MKPCNYSCQTLDHVLSRRRFFQTLAAGGAAAVLPNFGLFTSPAMAAEMTVDQIMAELRPKLANYPGMKTYLQNPPTIRIGGKIQSPRLLHRVEPFYPPAAVIARLQGLVILEALVDRDGTVVDVKVLRSAGSVLDREALIAVRQWRYAPLVLNGQRLRFVVTVILSFSVQSAT